MTVRKTNDIRQVVIEKELKALDKVDGGLAAARIPDDVAAYRALLRDKTGLTDIQRRFLAAFSICGIVYRSAMAAGCTPGQHYKWLRLNPEYKEAHAQAVQISNEYLEGVALELAIGMRTEPVVSAGKYLGDKPIYDTRLLSILLKARMPDKYGNKVDITSNGHSIVKVIDKDTYDSI